MNRAVLLDSSSLYLVDEATLSLRASRRWDNARAGRHIPPLKMQPELLNNQAFMRLSFRAGCPSHGSARSAAQEGLQSALLW